MDVLGIDPGSHHTGWGFIRSSGNSFTYLDSGVIHAKGEELSVRLLVIAEGLEEILQRYKPQAVAVERVFHAKNSQSALLLGHARGAALVAVAQYHLPIYEYTPGQIKRAATGRGRAEKEQVQHMVRLLLRYQGAMTLDASDALAAAICHAQMARSETRIQALRRGV